MFEPGFHAVLQLAMGYTGGSVIDWVVHSELLPTTNAPVRVALQVGIGVPLFALVMREVMGGAVPTLIGDTTLLTFFFGSQPLLWHDLLTIKKDIITQAAS